MKTYDLALAIIAVCSAGILGALIGIGDRLEDIVQELRKRNAR